MSYRFTPQFYIDEVRHGFKTIEEVETQKATFEHVAELAQKPPQELTKNDYYDSLCQALEVLRSPSA